LTRLRIDLPDLVLAETTWEAVSALVLQRPCGGIGNGNCERCGKEPPTDPHHRKLRSRRGPDVPSNIAALGSGCHRWCHLNPAEAEDTGWIVASEGDHRVQPVRLWNGILTRLDDLYGYDVLEWPTAGHVENFLPDV
jgi:hypothetical protein